MHPDDASPLRRTGPRHLWIAAALVGAVAMGGGCARGDAFEDRTARLSLDGEVQSFTLDGCLLDDQTFVMAGRAEDGSVLQATVGVEPDGTTGVPASTGFTVIVDDGVDRAAFGAEAWARRGRTDDRPGEVEDAWIRGARVRASGSADPVDDEDALVPGDAVPFTLDARCDEPDDS